MNLQKLDSIGKRLAALVLCGLVALAVAGCGASATQIAAQNQLTLQMYKETLAHNDKQADRTVQANKDLLALQEKRLTAEAEAKRVKYGAMMTIAVQADAGGKAAIGMALAMEGANGGGKAADEPRLIAAPAPIAPPVLQPIKSTGEVMADLGKAVLNSPLIPTIGQITLGVVQAGVQKAQSRDNAATTQAMYAMFRGVNADTAGALRDLGGHAIDGLTTVGSKPTINITGDDSNVALGGNAVRTNTVQCPQTVGGTAGNGGSGGMAGAGGNAASGGNGGSGAGALGGASGSAGAGGAGGPGASGGPLSIQATSNCTAGK